MASATGIPENASPAPETEPLLGRPGDASQQEGKGLQYNLIIGTGIIAQAGIWILAALVWAAIFTHDLIFFSAHPLLNSAGILFLVQGILVVQPTSTPKQKSVGTTAHFVLNLVGFLALVVGLIIIEINKGNHERFTSAHGRLGLITYILIVIQALVGFAQYFIPSTVFGSVENGKKIYKYHRISGYLILLVALATICAATQTTLNENVLHIQLWAIIVASALVVVGVVPRIKKAKLGF